MKKDVISAAVSQDAFHDPIDPDVLRAFGEHTNDVTAVYSHGHTYSGGRDPKPQGRARELLEWDEPITDDHCACDSHLVQPDGQIRQCGCLDAPIIGNVNDGLTGDNSYGMPLPDSCCWRSEEFQEWAAQSSALELVAA